MKSIIIAAPHSGSGKTTITLGLMECLKRRGVRVAPFKVGPDFIDPGYHRLVCGCPSINLDGWICSPNFVRQAFACHAAGADISIIEGVMGLFDGISGLSDEGSTAEVAKITGSPVILVVDAKSQARSAAALIKGFAEFDPRVKIAGVIFNNVASENHARLLRDAVGSTGVKLLGCIPRDERLRIPSRHLGLVTADENPLPTEFLDHLAEVVRDHLDLALLWSLGNLQSADQPLPFEEGDFAQSHKKLSIAHTHTRIAVARDAAFCFIYEDNLRLLREAGGELIEFSPLHDQRLPDDIGGIYLPGGYPELFAETLAENSGIKEAIRGAVEGGMAVYAECGGFMYLTQGIRGQVSSCGHTAACTCEGLTPFVGIFPVATAMLPRRKALGYREIELAGDTILGVQGAVARGHEFHYSEVDEMPPHVKRVYRVRKSGIELGFEGFSYKNCLASYVHLHFGSNPGMAAAFVESCRRYDSENINFDMD